MNDAILQSWIRVVAQVAKMYEEARPRLGGRWPEEQGPLVDAVGEAMLNGTNEDARNAVDHWHRRWCAWLVRAGK